MTQPLAVRITRLVSRPGRGAELVDRCRRIAERELPLHPGAYHVVQARRPVDGDRVELVSITEWHDLGLMARVMPDHEVTEPAFHDEYADVIEVWSVDAYEVTFAGDA